MGMIKDAAKEGLRGATEGIGKKAAEAGLNATTTIASESAKAIKTRMFGLGKGDEAKFSLALSTLGKDEREIIKDFLKTLSPGECDGLRQTIAEMDTRNAGVVLNQYSELPDDKARRERGEVTGLIKKSFFEKIDLGGFAKSRDFWAKKMEKDIERRR